MVNDIRKSISAFIDGATPGVLWVIYNRLTGIEEVEITKELADEYDRIAKRMREERRGRRPAERRSIESLEDRVINHLDRYLETEKKVELKKALTLAEETGCSVCTKYIQAAIDAAEEGDVEESIEWVGGVRRGLRIVQKDKS